MVIKVSLSESPLVKVDMRRYRSEAQQKSVLCLVRKKHNLFLTLARYFCAVHLDSHGG